MLDNKVILVTGGTGSFGKKFSEYVFKNYNPKKLIIFSRDEFKQYQMEKSFPKEKYPIRFFLGDIRDRDRLYKAFDDVDYVIHAAALKQVPALEYNPFEAVKTNILGAQNIIEAAIHKGVKKVIALSTDKAVSPINLYGATKMTMEKLFIAASVYVKLKKTVFSCVRYGNVLGSRGSVVPFFIKLKNDGVIKMPVTDERMTRFWLTLDQGINLVCTALNKGVGGEIFVPKIPSMKILDLVKAITGNGFYEIIGIRPGEKIHETLIHREQGKNTYDMGSYYLILSQFELEKKWLEQNLDHFKGAKKVPEGFIYRSDTNNYWLSTEELTEIIPTFKYE